MIGYLPGDILVKADRASMANSLEARCPLLDHRVVEFASTLPTRFKVMNGKGKLILRRVLYRRVPEELVERPKMGFSVPLAAWFRTSLKGTFETSVLNGDMAAYLDCAEAGRYWKEHQSGLHDHSRKLWNMLMLACWQQRHNTGIPANLLSGVSGD